MKNLHKRLADVSRNNVAYIEAYGTKEYWGDIYKRLSKLPDKELLPEVLLLEDVLEDLEHKMKIEELEKENKKLKAQQKLQELGLTIDDLRSLL